MYRNALVATDGSEIASMVLDHVAKVVDPDGLVLIVQVIHQRKGIPAAGAAGWKARAAAQRPQELGAPPGAIGARALATRRQFGGCALAGMKRPIADELHELTQL